MITKKEIVEIIKETIQREVGVTVGSGHRSFDVHMLTGWHYSSNPKNKYGYIILSDNYICDLNDEQVMSINDIICRIFKQYQYNVIFMRTKIDDDKGFHLRYQFRNQELEVSNA